METEAPPEDMEQDAGGANTRAMDSDDDLQEDIEQGDDVELVDPDDDDELVDADDRAPAPGGLATAAGDEEDEAILIDDGNEGVQEDIEVSEGVEMRVFSAKSGGANGISSRVPAPQAAGGSSDEPQLLEDYAEEYEEEGYENQGGQAEEYYEEEEEFDDEEGEEDPLVTARPSKNQTNNSKGKQRVQEAGYHDLPCMILQYGDELHTVFSNPTEDHPIYQQFADVQPIFEGRGDLVEGLLYDFLFSLKDLFEIKDVDVTLEFPDLNLSFGQVS
jgi:hypothetical protein